MVSQQLVDQWRAKLAGWQQRLDEGRPRPWLARAYVRVLRFLLAQYGQHSEGESLAEVQQAPELPRTKLAMAATDLSGKPPRTGADIRSVLQAVQANVPQVQAGPLVDGLPPSETIAVAAFYSSFATERLIELLARSGIDGQIKPLGKQFQVFVQAEDLDRAQVLVRSHAKSAADSSLYRRQFAREWSLKGAHIGGASGLVAAVVFLVLITHASDPDNQPGLGFDVGFMVFAYTVIIFGGLGCAIGYLLGTFADG